MATIDEIISEIQALRQKAASYDKLVRDLVTILDECHYRVDKDRLLPQTSTESSRPKDTKVPRVNKKLWSGHALWKCNKCGVFNIRSSKHIKLSYGEWQFTDTVQGRCPIASCHYRQRLSPKITRIYADKVEARTHRDFFQKHNATEWLD